MSLGKHTGFTLEWNYWRSKQCKFPLSLTQGTKLKLFFGKEQFKMNISFQLCQDLNMIHRWDEQTVALPVIRWRFYEITIGKYAFFLPCGGWGCRSIDVVHHFLWGHHDNVNLPVESSQMEPNVSCEVTETHIPSGVTVVISSKSEDKQSGYEARRITHVSVWTGPINVHRVQQTNK